MDREEAQKVMTDSIGSWWTWGLAITFAGVLALLGSFVFDPTIEASILSGERVVNLHALATKVMILICGATAFISGVICLAVSAIIHALRASSALK